MPNSWMDKTFPYPTPKIARIKDSTLGLLRYTIYTCIAVYMLVFQVLYRGNHLNTQKLSGVRSLYLAQPTQHNCNPVNLNCKPNYTSMSELNYCAQSVEHAEVKLPCKYMDAPSLKVLTGEGAILPSRISTFWQARGCDPKASNNWTCDGPLWNFIDESGHVEKKAGKAQPINDNFVADIEHFSLTIDHSVRAGLGKRYYAQEMKGFWLDCAKATDPDGKCKSIPIDCEGKMCHSEEKQLKSAFVQTEALEGSRDSMSFAGGLAESESEAQESEQADTISQIQTEQSLQLSGPLDAGISTSNRGDRFKIWKLLDMANVSLSDKRHHAPGWMKGSYRSAGVVLVVSIAYSNIGPWLGTQVWPWAPAGAPVHYTYRISKHDSHDDFRVRKVFRNDTSHTRTMKEYAGIRLLIEQGGSMAVWVNVQFMLILTTALGIINFSHYMLDQIMLNCMPRSADYAAIKFDRPRKKAPGSAQSADDNIQRYSSMTM